MNKIKCISIVVPVYNAKENIDMCVQSLINQEYRNIEIILVDDGSSDNSLEICNKYALQDYRVKVYSKTNGGVSSARNYGIDVANGDYICFVDSDDYVEKDYCSKLLNYVYDDVNMVVLGLRKSTQSIDEHIKHRLSRGFYTYKEISKIIIDDGTLSGFTFHSSCSILFNLTIIKNNNIKFDERIKYNEDGLFNTIYFFSLSTGKIYVDYSDAVYVYRVNNTSSSNNINIDRYKSDMFLIDKILANICDENVEEQLLKRRATIALDIIMIYKQNNVLSFNNLKNMVYDKNVISGFKSIDNNKLNFKKRTLLILLRFKFIKTIILLINITS